MMNSIPFNLPTRYLVIISSLIASLLIGPLFISDATGKQLKPFTSDGCSSFPDGTIDQNTLWLDCCVKHDFSYWKGGTYNQRKIADIKLRECVAQVGEPEVAELMLAGVRVGGTPFFPTSFRWGYGWKYPKFYGKLTLEENSLILKTLKASGNMELLLMLREE